MALLDGMPKSREELESFLSTLKPLLEEIQKTMLTSKEQRDVLELMNKGLSLGDILGIEKKHRDVLLAHVSHLMHAQKYDEALNILTMLHTLEPLDERVIYGLGIIFQIKENYHAASQLYVNFLALDATNPEGYLRLGECFLAAKEKENAESSFKTALSLSKRGYGKPQVQAYAEKMIALCTPEEKSKS